MYRRRFQFFLVFAERVNGRALLVGKAPREIGSELGFEQRYAVLAATAVTDGVFDGDIGGLAAVFEKHLYRVGDGALFRIEIILRPFFFLDALHFAAQRIDTRIARDIFFIVGRSEVALNQTDSAHVLNAMVAIGGIIERAFFVDDADGGFVGGDDDIFDVVQAIFHIRVQRDRAFHRGLRMELSRERNLEQHVFHHV